MQARNTLYMQDRCLGPTANMCCLQMEIVIIIIVTFVKCAIIDKGMWYQRLVGTAITHQLFGDNLKLFCIVKTSANAASLQSALGHLQQWHTDWQLTINIKKCFVLHLGKTNS